MKKRAKDSSSRGFIRATNVTHSSIIDDPELPIFISDPLLDLVRAFDKGLGGDCSSRAITLIGPYGSGKSTGLVALKRLCDEARVPKAGKLWPALRKVDFKLSATLARSLSHSGKLRFLFISASEVPLTEMLPAELESIEHARIKLRSSPRSGKTASNSTLIGQLTEVLKDQNLVLVIDELGRILERAMISGSTTELQLLQDLAELTQRSAGKKFFLITAQHHSTLDYSQGRNVGLVRELAKVQGRFQEVLFVNSFESTLRLLVTELKAFHKTTGVKRKNRNSSPARKGRNGKWSLLNECSPLNPVAALTLVELSRRYAQSTRTLMTFIKSDDRFSLRDLLNSFVGDHPQIYADEIFDYFVTSQITSVHSSDSDGKWRELAALIRDNSGLHPDLLSLLKTVAVLNLAASSSVNAQFETLASAYRLRSRAKLRENLHQLQTLGLITFREGEGEYRAWRGSAFPIDAELKAARSQVADISTTQLVNQNLEPSLHFARRVGVESGIDRVFAEIAASPEWRLTLERSWLISRLDGVILLALDSETLSSESLGLDHAIPTIIIPLRTSRTLRSLLIELTALRLARVRIPTNDTVALREIDERIHYFASKSSRELKLLRDSQLSRSLLHHDGNRIPVSSKGSIGSLLSEASRVVFYACPIVRNEMMAGRALSSQAAKAARLLTEAMFRSPDLPRFGIESNAAEGAIYDGIFALTGLGKPTHKVRMNKEVANSWSQVLDLIRKTLAESSMSRISVSHLVGLMTSAPFGVRKPLAVVVISAVMYQEKHLFSLFEHGSLVVDFDEAVAERLQKNPEHFTFRTAGSSTSQNRELVRTYRELLDINSQLPTSVEIARALITKLLGLPSFSVNTNEFLDPATIRLAKAIRGATDPDALLFVDIPEILLETNSRKRVTRSEIGRFKNALRQALDDLNSCYERLLKSIDRQILEELRISETDEHPSILVRGAALAVRDNLMHPKQKALVEALLRDDMSHSDWTQNAAMIVSQTGSPKNWSDENFVSFKVALREQMGNFRRLLSLCVQSGKVEESGETFALVNLVTTNGTYADQIIHLSNAERAIARDLQDAFVTKVRQLSGSDQILRALLLSLLFDIPLNEPNNALASGRVQSDESTTSSYPIGRSVS